MPKGHPNSGPGVLCSFCGTLFRTRPYKLKQPNLYCGWECKIASQRAQRTEPCEWCGADVTRRPSAFRRGRATRVFCNRSCASKWRQANPSAERLANYGKEANKFRGLYGTKCFLCGFDRFIEFCHLIPARDGGSTHPDNIVCLCPNHHTLMDKNLLSLDEMGSLADKREKALSSAYSRRFRKRRIYHPPSP
jgi:hypothetical protein